MTTILNPPVQTFSPSNRRRRRRRIPWRRIILAAAIVALWQLYVSVMNVSPLLFSSPTDVVRALVDGWTDGSLASAAVTTLKILGLSMLIGTFVAIVIVVCATWTRIGEDFLVLVSSILNPLPSIAILPLAMIWFGLSTNALIFVVANAVIWPIAINAHMGFKTVNPTIIAVGKNIGLGPRREITDLLLPAALPYILTGLRTALAFGWRTVVAAELVFGVAGGKGGIGYFINNARYFMNIDQVFAALVTIAGIGISIEYLFAMLERRTVIRWGLKSTG
jgi:NitT/TauT family transport system permease protein